MMNNRRVFSRIESRFPTKVIFSGNRAYESTASSISMNGLFFPGPIDCQADETCHIIIMLDPTLEILIDGAVRRITKDGVGIEFLEIKGPESFGHLKNLVLYNAEDREKYLKELDEHIGLKPKKNS